MHTDTRTHGTHARTHAHTHTHTNNNDNNSSNNNNNNNNITATATEKTTITATSDQDYAQHIFGIFKVSSQDLEPHILPSLKNPFLRRLRTVCVDGNDNDDY